MQESEFPESLNSHILRNQDGIIGSTKISFYMIALRDCLKGKRTKSVMEQVGEAKRFLDIIKLRSILKDRRNTTGCLNANSLANSVCRIHDSLSRHPLIRTNEELRRVEVYKRRVAIDSATLAKIIRGDVVTLRQVESVKKLLNDLHDVFWSMVMVERYRAGDDD